MSLPWDPTSTLATFSHPLPWLPRARKKILPDIFTEPGALPVSVRYIFQDWDSRPPPSGSPSWTALFLPQGALSLLNSCQIHDYKQANSLLHCGSEASSQGTGSRVPCGHQNPLMLTSLMCNDGVITCNLCTSSCMPKSPPNSLQYLITVQGNGGYSVLVRKIITKTSVHVRYKHNFFSWIFSIHKWLNPRMWTHVYRGVTIFSTIWN